MLIEVSEDFELARSIIREPVLLGSDEEADRAFAQAKEEMEFDLSLPVQYVDMPEGFEEENKGDENTKEKGKGVFLDSYLWCICGQLAKDNL